MAALYITQGNITLTPSYVSGGINISK